MKRREFIELAGLTMASTILGRLSGAAAASRKKKPNFVIIYADDLGYGDLACFGHPTIRTPHLDRMGTEGAKLTQFYSAASVCTPSRAALLTGRLPIRTGMCSSKRAVLFPDSAGGLPQREITIAKLLKKQGYATGCVGKWHLGHLQQYLPTSHGFDSYFGIPYSNDMKIDPSMPLAEDCRLREGMTAERIKSEKPRAHWVPLMRGDKVIEYPCDQKTLTKRYAREAVQFIKESSDEPFFLYFAHTMPHIPLFVSDDKKDTSLRGLYGDVIEQIDWTVGQILDTLRQQGIADNTLVLFSSDNGPWLVFKQHGGSAGLLRDGKGSTWEGGMREPTLAWWPGTIKPGSMFTDMASTLDVLPTIAELAGADLPSDRIFDGTSLVPLLTQTGPGQRDIMVFYRGDQLRAIRKGPWKMHLYTKTEYTKSKVKKHDPPLLYNIEHDPSEKYDLGAKHPDIIRDLQKEITKHQATLEAVPSQLERRQT
jgi:arylsulfatase A